MLWQRSPGKARFWTLSLLMGCAFGCVLATKLNGLILALLVAPLLLKMRREDAALKFMAAFLLGAVVIWCSVWQLHFHLGRKIVSSLDDKGYFHASQEYRGILNGSIPRSWTHFPMMLSDSISFVKRYQDGVPALNLCKADENGSPSFFWPFGARSINYRWEGAGENGYRYLYLQANPLVWWSATAGVAVVFALLIAACLYPQGVVLKQKTQILAFCCLYAGYMAVMARLDRVMYLYHYFLPLVFSFILLALLLGEINNFGRWRLEERHKEWGLAVLLLGILGCFLYYAPLTYYWPIRHEALKRRAWSSLWDLTCVGCGRSSMIAKPIAGGKDKGAAAFAHLKISGVAPVEGSQQWGEARHGRSVIDKPVIVGGVRYEDSFGVHADSRLKYRLNKRFKRFHVSAALPDYLEGKGSVVFEVYADKKLLWRSPLMRSGTPAAQASLSVEGMDLLELGVSDAGDGISYDHGVWINPRLER